MLQGLDPGGPMWPPCKNIANVIMIILLLELSLISSFVGSTDVSINRNDIVPTQHITGYKDLELKTPDYSDLELNTPDYSEFSFTQGSYNGSIYENSVGKVYVESADKMGIFNSEPDVTVKFKIVDGDPEQFFKAEAEQVGNFVFLLVRIRTSSVNVLNRERTDSYALKIRATFRDSSKQRLRDIKASCVVNVEILDTNDLDPFFSPTEYSVTVPEDQAVHAPIVTVKAEDADSGINGEIYYNIAEKTDLFTIHPVTGVISLARNLVYSEKAKHRITIEARDRGMTYSYGSRRVDTATVTINVEQVNRFDPEMKIQHLPEVVEQSNTDIYAIIQVQDKDPGNHGQVDKVEIIEGDPDAHFRVTPSRSSPSEFNIEVLKLLDREIAPKGYNLTLKATDKGVPPR
jgi:protocadherin Fat 1/2/3